MGLFECSLIFVDKNVGEFYYSIRANAMLPRPIDVFHWNCKVGQVFQKEIRVSTFNVLRDKAIAQYVSDLVAEDMEIQNKGKAEKFSEILKLADIEREKDKYQLPKLPLKYQVSYNSNFFKGPSEIVIRPTGTTEKKGPKFKAMENHSSELVLEFRPDKPGKYYCQIVLLGLTCPDVRVYYVVVNVSLDKSFPELKFSSPSRKSIIQELPVINNTEIDQTYKASFSPLSNTFSGPSQLLVKANSTGMYSLFFLRKF
jgi:hypothetical protein